jgi:hypothetical protein
VGEGTRIVPVESEYAARVSPATRIYPPRPVTQGHHVEGAHCKVVAVRGPGHRCDRIVVPECLVCCELLRHINAAKYASVHVTTYTCACAEVATCTCPSAKVAMCTCASDNSKCVCVQVQVQKSWSVHL